ncbi:MAG: cation transporter [Burkholderiaceae bacterium]|nr:cation transporter [Burkholderiaceae bacterium]
MSTFDVKGMTCGHCIQAVTKAVRELDAQARVDVDLEGGKVQVDSTMPPSAIERAIAEAGYEAKARAA